MSLHGNIMNISDKVTENKNAMSGNDAFIAYKEGHRDARHAAAELALKADACIDALRKFMAAGVCNSTDFPAQVQAHGDASKALEAFDD